MGLLLLSALLLLTHIAAALIFFAAGCRWGDLRTLRWCVRRVEEAERDGLARRR